MSRLVRTSWAPDAGSVVPAERQTVHRSPDRSETTQALGQDAGLRQRVVKRRRAVRRASVSVVALFDPALEPARPVKV